MKEFCDNLLKMYEDINKNEIELQEIQKEIEIDNINKSILDFLKLIKVGDYND